jgi:flagellin-like hook-associated protein FlgL
MNRISGTSYFDQSIANIQNSYEKLVKLQTQVQTQLVMERPSDDPVRANQSIMLESTLKEIQQYQANVQNGSDLLTYSDQMIDNLMAPLNQAIEKVAQGLNAEQDATSRSAISAELNSILDTFISIGNTQINGKNIFGGSENVGEVFTRLGGDILFNGNNETYSVSVSQGETIQANLLAKDVFGASSTLLTSERNLDPRLAEMSFDSGLPVNKLINSSLMAVDGRNAALQAFSKAGFGTASTEYGNLKTNLGALATADYSSMNTYLDKVRDAVSSAFSVTSSTLSVSQSNTVKLVLDAAKKVYADNSTTLVLQADRNIGASKLNVTIDASNSASASSIVDAINAARLSLAGVDGSGNIDHSKTVVNARLEVFNALKTTASKLGLSDATMATTYTNMAAVITATTVSGTAVNVGSTTSSSYAKLIQDAAVKVFDPLYPAVTAGFSYTSLTADQKTMTDAMVQAGKNAFSATEFSAVSTRSGLSITHDTSDLITIDKSSSDENIVRALELGQSNNASIFTYKSGDITNATLAGDRLMTLSNSAGKFIDVQLRQGDTADVIARRINRAVNQFNVADDLRTIVAKVDKSSGNDRLVLSGNGLFDVKLDTAVANIADGTAKQYSSLKGSYRSAEDMRSGSGLTLGTQKLLATDLVTEFDSTITILAGDSLDYVVQQLNDLSGFSAQYNSSKDGLQLNNEARYALNNTSSTLSVANGTTLTFTKASGLSQSVTLSATGTFSERAEQINALSTSAFRLHAEVNALGNGLVISSNEALSVGDGTITVAASDLSSLNLIDSQMLTSLGLSRSQDATGQIVGKTLLNRQVRLSELNDGQGITKGSIRVSVGITSVDVDLSSAATLRDVKIMLEAALPGLIKVDLNHAGNGLAIKSTSSTAVRLEELFGGSTARTLGLVKAPSTSVTSTDIQGSDLNPQFSGVTRLKDLNGGRGLDSSGFLIKNGSKQTTITLDSNGDGVDDIRTLEGLVNHINQISKQNDVFIKASIDAKNGGLKIVSQLSNTNLEITEVAARNSSYRTTGIPAVLADTITIFNADRSKSVAIPVNGATDAASMASLINTSAAALTTDFGFRAIVNQSGTVDILSHESILVSKSTTTYGTVAFSPNPPVYGTTASDLGLLGSFSDSTLISTLNNGTGIEHGSFILKYGSVNTPAYTLTSTATAGQVTFYNENASKSAIVVDVTLPTATEITNLSAMGITATLSGTTYTYSSSKRFIAHNDATKLDVPTQVSVNTLATTAKSVTVDLEFGDTLGDIKNAIQKATNNEILVDFDSSNRLQLRLASGDDSQRIEISELGGSLDVANTLGLIHNNIIYGRELRDGTRDILSSATLLTDLGLNLNATASANSGENDLVLLTASDSTTFDLSSVRTVGDVISLINSTRVSDNKNAVQFEAKIVNGRYLSIQDVNGGTVSALNSTFAQAAERLGLIPDPQLTGESHYIGADLKPKHQAENFFSALTVLKDEFSKGAMNQPIVSNTLVMLQAMQEKLLSARGEAGGRINRFDLIKTRYEEEAVFVEGLYGDKVGIDIIATTQRYLAQQQAYESGLSVASRILGTSLFTYI